MNFNNLLKKVITFYFIAFSIRSLIHLIIQCIYLSLCNYKQDNHSNNNETIENLIKLISNFMSNYGQIHRTSATTGVFYYCLLFFSSIVFYLIRVLSKGKYLNFYDELGFIAFIKNPKLESLNISAKIEICLNNLISSNLNYGRMIFARSFNDYNYLAAKNKVRQREFSFDLIDSLKHQLSYITKLLSNKFKVWPPNRNPVWAQELTKFSLSVYMIVGSIIWFVAELGCCIIIYNLYKTINNQHNDNHNDYGNNNNALFTKSENRFTLFDRLWSADYLIYAYFGGDLFTTPLIVSITSIEDQLKFLDTFEPKLRKIYDKLIQLEQINSHIKSFSHLPNSNSNSNSSSSLNLSLSSLSKIRKKLKYQCDQEAIEMYISYQLFRDEVAPSIKLAQNAVGLNVTLSICCLLPTLFYYRDIPADQMLAFVCLGSTIILSINATFCMCASLHVNCSRVSKLIWSFIAVAESYNYREYSILSIEDDIIMDENEEDLLKLGLFCASDTSLTEMHPDSSYLKYYSHSLVTPHTVLLWRRLAESDELIVENFVCKLYGIFDITYKGILRINYLLIISVLYTLTYNN